MTDHPLFQQAMGDALEDPTLRALAAAGDEDAFRAAFTEALPDILRSRMERNEDLMLLATHNVTPSGGYSLPQGRAIREELSRRVHALARSGGEMRNA